MLSRNFRCLRSANHMKFTEECVMRSEKNLLVKKCLQKDRTWVCHYKPESKIQSMEWKHTNSPIIKTYRTQQSVKNEMLLLFWDMKGHIRIGFLEKGATVLSASYWQILRQNSLYLMKDPSVNRLDGDHNLPTIYLSQGPVYSKNELQSQPITFRHHNSDIYRYFFPSVFFVSPSISSFLSFLSLFL